VLLGCLLCFSLAAGFFCFYVQILPRPYPVGKHFFGSDLFNRERTYARPQPLIWPHNWKKKTWLFTGLFTLNGNISAGKGKGKKEMKWTKNRIRHSQSHAVRFLARFIIMVVLVGVYCVLLLTWCVLDRGVERVTHDSGAPNEAETDDWILEHLAKVSRPMGMNWTVETTRLSFLNKHNNKWEKPYQASTFPESKMWDIED